MKKMTLLVAAALAVFAHATPALAAEGKTMTYAEATDAIEQTCKVMVEITTRLGPEKAVDIVTAGLSDQDASNVKLWCSIYARGWQNGGKDLNTALRGELARMRPDDK